MKNPRYTFCREYE